MLEKEEITVTGRFRKPHGAHGEIAFTFTDDFFDENMCPFFISEIDGILVPFRILEYRLTSGTSGTVSLANLDSADKVRFLTGKEIYFPKKHLKSGTNDNPCTVADFTGFTIIDEQHGKIGIITDIDTSTINTLFIIETETGSLLVPAAAEYITDTDEERKELFVSLPEGLIS
jgi:16S rRNA processing protein RimM